MGAVATRRSHCDARDLTVPDEGATGDHDRYFTGTTSQCDNAKSVSPATIKRELASCS